MSQKKSSNIFNAKIFVKSLVYRIFATCITTVVVYTLTTDITLALTFSVLDIFLKIAAYYIFDIVWSKVT